MSELFFRDEGDGEPLLLLHGLGAQSRVFDPLFARRGSRRLIAVDLPRTARSGKWASSTPEQIASALIPFLESRGVKRFSVFGHSFGGVVALELTTRVSARVTALTVASAPALGLPSEFKFLLANPLADAAMSWFGAMPVWRPGLRAYLQLIWGDAKMNDAQLAVYEEAIAAKDFSAGMLEALRSLGAYRLPYAVLRDLNIPRRAIWGERDRLVAVAEGEQLARAIGAQLEVLPGIGHCVPEEAPDVLATIL